MGHRHLFSPSYIIETDNDQSWNLTEHPYMHTARTMTSESTSSIIYPDNMSIDGAQFSHCNHPQITTTYSSSLPQTLQIPNYQQNPVTSDLSMHTSYTPHEDYRTQASSSSNYNGNPFNEDLFDIRNTRGHYKRKSPGVPDGTTNNGSSADVTMITEQPWQETPPSINFLHAPWDYNNNTTTPDLRSSNNNGLSIGESSRNVRSRGTFDLESSNSSRSHLTSNLARDYFTTSRPMDVSPSVDLNGLNRNWNPPAHENNSLNCEMNPFLDASSNNPNSSLEIGHHQQQQQQNNNLVTRNNHALQNFQNTSSSSIQSVRGIRSNFSQRPGSTFRVSSSNLRLGHTDEGLQLATNNNYSSRNQRLPSSSSSTLGWHSSNNDRSGRARLSSERYRAFSGVNFHDRAQPEGLVIVDRSAFYGSRNPFDQHRDMRLDIDDMSYEELLALGERIGSVATGLPDHLISKCVQESIYCSSDQIQDECTCVICLEEYANMDDIGMLKACGHDFHVGCIRKWLSMKNVCPICKAEPMKQK